MVLLLGCSADTVKSIIVKLYKIFVASNCRTDVHQAAPIVGVSAG